MSKPDIALLLQYNFQNPEILQLALTHSSMGKPNNERLEFLGDRVLAMVITEFLFHNNPAQNEGILANSLNNLVNKTFLANLARTIALEQFYNIHPNSLAQLPATIHANMVESVIGALYIDGGYDIAKQFVLHHWAVHLNKKENQTKPIKSLLQEKCQQNGHDIPEYRVIDRLGPDHLVEFVVMVDCAFGTAEGRGPSKNEAMNAAAQNLWNKIHD